MRTKKTSLCICFWEQKLPHKFFVVILGLDDFKLVLKKTRILWNTKDSLMKLFWKDSEIHEENIWSMFQVVFLNEIILCWNIIFYGKVDARTYTCDCFTWSVSFWNIVEENISALLQLSSISWSEKIWARVLISCQGFQDFRAALLIIWGLREAKRVREILIHRVQARKSSFPTPDKNSWNRQLLSCSRGFHRKFQRDNFFLGKTRSRILQVKSQVMQFCARGVCKCACVPLCQLQKFLSGSIFLVVKKAKSFVINFHWNSSFVSLCLSAHTWFPTVLMTLWISSFNTYRIQRIWHRDEQSKRTKDAYIICETTGGPRIFIG